MRKITVFLGAALSAIPVLSATLDGIAAKVNDAVITVGDVMAELRRSPEARRAMGAGDAQAFKAVYADALDHLVDRRLILLCAASEKKLDIQEWVVDNRVREIVKERFDGDVNKLESLLAEGKTSMSEFRDSIREDLVVSAMRYQFVDKNVSASPFAMRREFAAHPERYRLEARATVDVILLKPSDDAATPAVSTRAEEILERLGRGEDFAELARRYSSDSHAKDGGRWPDVKPEDTFRPEIVAVIAKLKDGEHSQLVDLDGWGFIVKRVKSDAARERTFAEAWDDVAANLREEDAKTRYLAWVRRLRDAAYLKIYPIPDPN